MNLELGKPLELNLNILRKSYLYSFYNIGLILLELFCSEKVSNHRWKLGQKLELLFNVVVESKNKKKLFVPKTYHDPNIQSSCCVNGP
jgi:hypothetical protein